MSESVETTETTTEIKAKEHKEPKPKEQDYDPYCCTPPGDGGGPDTKP